MTTTTLATIADRQDLQLYVTLETMMGAAIKTFTSVPSTGGVSLVTNAISQSLMVAKMSPLPISLLTRARARRGA